MTDYGHDLQFGVFLTPTAADAAGIVELAEAADVAGLDLVTVQDHPYQARFLDTWTLLSVIAARTSQVRVAPNVANLPLRPPVMLARAAASLDLLSGGRVELGLGAGAFWDAIVAVGGPRRSPGEAVDATAEAIEIIRAVWQADGPSLRHRGQHYQVVGAHAGPAPAHQIEIWLGAYGKRMLALTGEAADGWLPSMGYADPDALPAMNAAIDVAARAAGRMPSQIRRLYNVNGNFGAGSGAGFLQGSARDWAEQLSALTLEQGISGYILACDNETDLRRFADEVAPAVRELVEVERARAGGSAVVAGPEPTRAARTASLSPGALKVTPTVDDGNRRSAERLWDESARPTGPAADSDRTYTAHEQAAGQHLVDIHDALRAELTQLDELIAQVAAGSIDVGAARSAINKLTLRQNNWTLGVYCEQYCRIVTGHHGLEDRSVFPHLRSREPALAPVLDRLEDEHEVIAEVLDRVDRALVEMVRTDGDLTALHQAIDLLHDTLLSHLAYEERELVEPLARFGYY